MLICTTAGGQTLAAPNVCKTPSPGGPVPIPYTSLGMFSNATGFSKKVKILNKFVCTVKSKISTTSTDEPGTAGGVVSGRNSDVATPVMGSKKVYAEGSPVVRFLDPMKSNGSSANTMGACIAPSQQLVWALS